MGELLDISPEDANLSFDNVPDSLTPSDDGKTDCPQCGGRYTVTKSGSIRSHNCNGVRSVSSGTSKTPAKRGKKTKRVPESVIKIGSPALASGIEYSARKLVARAVPCDPEIVPASIPDDDVHVMIDPIITLLWPNIPAKAQSVIESICDQEDLILCALAWIEYGQKLSAWTKDAHNAVAAQNKVKDMGNGIQAARTESDYGNGFGPVSLANVEPFAASG